MLSALEPIMAHTMLVSCSPATIVGKRKTVHREFRPQQTHCPRCKHQLKTYKTRHRLKIRGLTVTYRCRLTLLVCKNSSCQDSLQMAKTNHTPPRIYYPESFSHFAVPGRHLTWQLLAVIGQLRFAFRLNMRTIQHVLHLLYGLELYLSRLYEWSDLYEAACLAWHDEHQEEVHAALEALPERVYLIDLTEDTTKQPALRVFVASLGFGLLTMVIPHPCASAIEQCLQELDSTYGAPDLIVCDDDLAIKTACAAVWPEVPIQACFQHLFKNLAQTLLTPLVRRVQSILQKHSYKKRLKKLLLRLESQVSEPWPAHGEDLRQLIEYLLTSPPGGDLLQPRVLQTLQAFEQTWTHLNALLKAIQGHLTPQVKRSPEFEAWRALKAALPPEARFQGLQDPRLLADPFYKALLEVKTLVDGIHGDPDTRGTLKAWRMAQKELTRLRCWLWAVKLHRLQARSKNPTDRLTEAEEREMDLLQAMLKQQPAKQRRELTPLTSPSQGVPEAAAAFLGKLIQEWEAKGKTIPSFQKAARQLKGAAPDLTHFLERRTAPPSQQEIESQNNRLKQVLRQQSGHVANRFRFVYHAEPLTAVLNLEAIGEDSSPVERLGISLLPDHGWLNALSREALQKAWNKLQALRKPRREYLGIRKKGFKEFRKHSITTWLQWLPTRVKLPEA